MQSWTEAAETVAGSDERLHSIFTRIDQMHRSLSDEDYFIVLEGLIDRAREMIEDVDDPREREDMRRFYGQVVDYALGLKLGDAA